MIPTKTRNPTIVFTPPANWNAEKDGPCGNLEVRVDTYGQSELAQLTSTWAPTENDLYLLSRGGVVEVHLLTSAQPAMAVSVVSPVEPIESEPMAAPAPVDEFPPAITIDEASHGHE